MNSTMTRLPCSVRRYSKLLAKLLISRMPRPPGWSCSRGRSTRFAAACATSKGPPLSSTVMIIRSARASTVIEIKRGFAGSVCGRYAVEEERTPPCRTILDMSSSRQTCMSNTSRPGRSKSAAIDSIQLAAAAISGIAPLKMRCQLFWGVICREKGTQAPKTAATAVKS